MATDCHGGVREEESWVSGFFERTRYSNPIFYTTGSLTDPHVESPEDERGLSNGLESDGQKQNSEIN